MNTLKKQLLAGAAELTLKLIRLAAMLWGAILLVESVQLDSTPQALLGLCLIVASRNKL